MDNGLAMPSDGRILVHACCAPCAAPAVERLREHGLTATLLFSNSNISPQEEYRRRLESVRRLAECMEVALVEDDYDHEAWLAAVRGREHEPERGARCRQCFEFNLGRTAAFAERQGWAAFTTTLTLGPQKDTATIFTVGRQLGAYQPWDFKKADGFRRSLSLCREYDLYRQDYCGCEFSLAARCEVRKSRERACPPSLG